MNRWMYLTLAHRGEKQKKGGQGGRKLVGRVTVYVTWVRHGFAESHFNFDLLCFWLFRNLYSFSIVFIIHENSILF